MLRRVTDNDFPKPDFCVTIYRQRRLDALKSSTTLFPTVCLTSASAGIHGKLKPTFFIPFINLSLSSARVLIMWLLAAPQAQPQTQR